ncbi:peptidase A4 family-domain-containing protein [Boletus reticuloceps]|uniref:Peptidase A4 family-domain-containing protein n=1 Tax=Boletus reticuloceps TaxID=495285 RepID=A0A8I2YP65_9AGAM|nr:peptidase A4 family-domain-containing protein [Boletus reticuloceps]
MVSKFALLANILLASAALAVPSSRLEARLARRRENRQSQPLNHVDGPAADASNVEYSSNWSGAVWDEAVGTFTTVTGTFTVPTPSGKTGSAASAWVGIDGDTCQTAILQTGVDFIVGRGGSVSYDAWYEWYPDYAYDFTGISISAGDVIKTTVTATSTTSGSAVIENLTNGQTVTQDITSTYALCEQNAEWIVEDFEEGGRLVPLADFGTVTFTSASASGPGVTYTPSGATEIDIEQNGQILTNVTISGSSVTIQYV